MATNHNPNGSLGDWLNSLPAGTIVCDNASDWDIADLYNSGADLDAPYIGEDAQGLLLATLYTVKVTND